MATVGRYETRLFRPPYGRSNSEGAGSIRANVYSTLAAQQLGYTEAGFTIGSDDYAHRPGSVIPVPAFGGPGLPGELVVMHDTAGKNDSSAVRLTERISQKAQALGYRRDQVPRPATPPAVRNADGSAGRGGGSIDWAGAFQDRSSRAACRHADQGEAGRGAATCPA